MAGIKTKYKLNMKGYFLLFIFLYKKAPTGINAKKHTKKTITNVHISTAFLY